MKNVFLIHSYNGDTEYSFAPSIKKLCEENKIGYFFPRFPVRWEAIYEGWEKVLNEYVSNGIFNEETIVIAHSLGTHFILKYLARNNIKINTYVSVAGFSSYEGRKDLAEVINRFHPSEEEFAKCKMLINNIYSIYSDNDEISPIEKLELYADKLGANKILIKGAGHFNPISKVTEIKELNKIVVDTINKI